MSGIAGVVEAVRLQEMLHHRRIAGAAGNAHDPGFLPRRCGEKRVEKLASVATANITNNATVGQNAVVTGDGITVEAVNTSDKENDLIVWGLAGSGGRERTPNSPGSRRPEAPTRKARCRRREGSTKLDAPGSARTRRVRVRLRTERNFMSRTDPTALTDALFAQRSLTRRAIQASGPAVFSVEGPATAALGR